MSTLDQFHAFQPDPVAMMPKVDVAQFKCMDDLINGIINDLGEKGFKVGCGAIMKTVDGVGAVAERTASGVGSAMQTNITPTGTPRMESSNTPSNGLSRTPSVEYDHMRAQSGQFSSPHTPSQGLSVTEIQR